MDTHVITITRQFGSLGRIIGQKVAAELGYAYYDRDIIEKAAEETGEPVYDLADYDGHSYSKYGKMMFPLGNGLSGKQKKLFDIEKKVMLGLSAQHDCVIIGRCSDYVMHEAGVEKLFSVFIYAPYNARYNFCLNVLGLQPEAAEVYIGKVDAARERFYKEYTGKEFDSPAYRNLMLDSSAFKMEDAVQLICKAALMNFRKD